MAPLSCSKGKFTLQSGLTLPWLVFECWDGHSIIPPHRLKLLTPPAYITTANFPHLLLPAFLEHSNKTFFSVWLRNSTWSTEFTTTFTYPTRCNMTIFHLMLAIVFQTGKNKHPQNISRIFYLKSSLFD